AFPVRAAMQDDGDRAGKLPRQPAQELAQCRESSCRSTDDHDVTTAPFLVHQLTHGSPPSRRIGLPVSDRCLRSLGESSKPLLRLVRPGGGRPRPFPGRLPKRPPPSEEPPVP